MTNKVSVSINGIKGEVEEGTQLLDAAAQIGAGVAHLCFGNGLCSTCRVRVVSGEKSLSEKQMKERVSLDYHLCFDPSVRLACQCTVQGPEPLEVVTPKPFSMLAPKAVKPRAPKPKKVDAHGGHGH